MKTEEKSCREMVKVLPYYGEVNERSDPAYHHMAKGKSTSEDSTSLIFGEYQKLGLFGQNDDILPCI